MSKDIELYERIDLYLNHELSAEALKAFEEELSWNTELQEQLELQALTNESIVDFRLSKVKALAQSYSEKTIRTNTYQNYLKGGLVVLLTGATTLYFLWPSAPKESALISSKSAEPISSSVQVKQKGSTSTAAKQSTANAELSAAKQTENKKIGETAPVLVDSNSHVVVATKKESLTAPLVSTKTVELKKESIVADPCKGILLTATAQVKASCAGKNNGTLFIDEVSGGQAPYRFALNDDAFSSGKWIENLSPGNYTLHIQDAKGCTTDSHKTYTIATMACPVTGKYLLSPMDGQTWKIPTEGNAAKLKIVNKAGQLIYATDIRNGESQEWDGKDQHNTYPEPGAYLYLLEFLDGHIEQGYITIEL